MALLEIDSYDAFSERAAEGAYVVYFTADWCVPCRRAAPLIARIAESDTSIDIIKIDVDVLPELAERFDVQGVPTFIVISDDGEEQRRQVGITPAKEMREFLAG